MLNFDFKVGEIEIHEVEFYFNQFWGNLYIKLDGNIMIKTIRLFSFKLSKSYRFDVGEKEKYSIKLEIVRKLFLAGLREHVGKVYINEKLQHEFRGELSIKDLLNKQTSCTH